MKTSQRQDLGGKDGGEPGVGHLGTEWSAEGTEATRSLTCASPSCLQLSWTSAPSTTALPASMTVTYRSGPSVSTREGPPTTAPVCQASLGMAEPAKVRGCSDFSLHGTLKSSCDAVN